jgi:predicted nucleic acid-binding Zn ribbon protein
LEHIAASLKNLIKKQGLEKELNQQKAIDIWSEVVGKKINENTEPVSVEFGILTVKTSSSVWSQELQLQKQNIIQSINKKLTKTTIKDVRFI